MEVTARQTRQAQQVYITTGADPAWVTKSLVP